MGFNRSNSLSIGKYLKYYFKCWRADIFSQTKHNGESQAAAPHAQSLVMKPVANLDKNFAGIQKMRSAKGKAVIQ